MTFKCGMSEVVITPPLGSHMPGYFAGRRSTGVKDELYAKALVIESGETTMAIIVVDAITLQRQQVENIRERISQCTPLLPEQMMISATHTHTGPPIRPTFDGNMDEAYNQFFTKKIADAAILAYRKLKPAHIGCGKGQEDGIAFNRRYWMKDGTVQTNPGFAHPDLDRAAGPTDPEVLVVRIDDLDGNPIGVVTNFACHPDTVGGTENCADYPGELSRTIKKALGDQTVSLFILGTCGNINHWDFIKSRQPEPDHYRKMGRILAGEVLKVRDKIDYFGSTNPLTAKIERTFFTIPYVYPTEQQVQEAKLMLTAETSTDQDRFLAEHLLEVIDDPVDSVQVEIQACRIGELAVVGLPGEIFVEFGLSIKKDSPYVFNIMNTLCNASARGYVCTREAYEQGGYEPSLRRHNRHHPGNGELFVRHALELLKKMNRNDTKYQP